MLVLAIMLFMFTLMLVLLLWHQKYYREKIKTLIFFFYPLCVMDISLNNFGNVVSYYIFVVMGFQLCVLVALQSSIVVRTSW